MGSPNLVEVDDEVIIVVCVDEENEDDDDDDEFVIIVELNVGFIGILTSSNKLLPTGNIIEE